MNLLVVGVSHHTAPVELLERLSIPTDDTRSVLAALVAQPFVKKLTWASGIGSDGRPILLPGYEPSVDGQLVCPAVAGAANWPSNAYSPATGLFYMFAEESCNIYSKNDQWW